VKALLEQKNLNSSAPYYKRFTAVDDALHHKRWCKFMSVACAANIDYIRNNFYSKDITNTHSWTYHSSFL